MNDIYFENTTKHEIKDEIETLEKLFSYATEKLNINDDLEFSVIFVDNEKIQDINKKYRNKDSITDVISFALEDEVEDEIVIKGLDMPRALGDIYISLDKCISQADEYGHTFLRELAFLSIHGLLHLLGYDHDSKEDEELMFKLQEEVLSSYGIKR